MLNNPVLSEAIWSFRAAYRKSKVPIWLKLQEMMERSSSNTEVNLSKLTKFTVQGDIVIVPGKVLGSGNINHKITLCAFSISEQSAKKIIDAGGKIFTIKEFVNKFPEGSGVKIVG